MNCSSCPFKHSQRPEEPEAREMKFFHEGVVKSAKMKPVNDSFYEIIEGEYKGSWVHTFNVIKN